MEMKALETPYKGYRFRSRTEARWAVFFDTMGFKWQYEPEGYELTDYLGNKEFYLPDFYLEDWDCYAEVKGTADGFRGKSMGKIKQLSIESKRPVVLLSGTPDYRAYPILVGDFHSRLSDLFDVTLTKQKMKGPMTQVVQLLQNDLEYTKAIKASRSERFGT